MKMDQAQRRRCCELEALDPETLAEMGVELESRLPPRRELRYAENLPRVNTWPDPNIDYYKREDATDDL